MSKGLVCLLGANFAWTSIRGFTKAICRMAHTQKDELRLKLVLGKKSLNRCYCYGAWVAGVDDPQSTFTDKGF